MYHWIIETDYVERSINMIDEWYSINHIINEILVLWEIEWSFVSDNWLDEILIIDSVKLFELWVDIKSIVENLLIIKQNKKLNIN